MSRYRLQHAIKTLIDRGGSVILLLLLSPLLVLIAAAIVFEDRGPAFFRQPRVGFKGRVFRVFKFRTMVVNADSLLDSSGRVTGRRVTRVGRILRSLSLDELPQLLNIIAGQMSFIGPRPVLVDHAARYSDEQRRRFSMKPGITGLAQVNGRNSLPWSKRLQLDVEYCDRWSLLVDLKILIKTVKVVLLREGIAADRNPDQVDDLPRQKPI